jgi:Conserved hypothetical protein (DUF2461)
MAAICSIVSTLLAKTNGQGYDANNPNIELLRLKNFTIGKKLQDKEVVAPGGLDKIAGLVGTMAPFVSSPLFHAAIICPVVARRRGSAFSLVSVSSAETSPQTCSFDLMAPTTHLLD